MYISCDHFTRQLTTNIVLYIITWESYNIGLHQNAFVAVVTFADES